MRNFLRPCNVFGKWEGGFLWFTAKLISKPKPCLHQNGTYHFTLFLWAFFPTVLPHWAGSEQSWTPFSQKHTGNVLCFYKTLLSHTHRGHWWASSTSGDSVVKGTEVTVMSLDQSCQARGRIKVTAHGRGLRQGEFHKWSSLFFLS